jgi:hypothetical protein
MGRAGPDINKPAMFPTSQISVPHQGHGIAIEANKPEAIAAMEKAFADIEGNVEIVVLPVLYPQGSEKHQIYATVKRIVPEGGLPIAVGCVVSITMFGFYSLFRRGSIGMDVNYDSFSKKERKAGGEET